MKLRHSLVAVIVAGLLPSTAIGQQAAPGRAAFERGIAAREAGDAAAARAAFEEAAAESRGWLLPRLELAEMAVNRRENVAEERRRLLEAAGPGSEVPRVHRLLAELAELDRDDQAALVHWTAAIERMPHDVGFRERRAAVNFRLGRYHDAAADWHWVVSRRPDAVHLRMLLADAYEQAGRYPEAKEQFEAAIRLQPEKEAPVRRYARFLERRGEMRAAMEQHARADRLRAGPQRPRRELRPLLPSRR